METGAPRPPRGFGDTGLGLWLIVPLGLVCALFLLGPVVFGVSMAFQRINSRTLNGEWAFNGLANWRTALGSDAFYAALPRTLVLAVGICVIGIVSALVFALVLHERFRGRGLVQVVVLIPWTIAPVAAGLMWRWIFDGNFGMLNLVASKTGLIDAYVPWLSKPSVAMGAAVLAESWRSVPLLVLLFSARLSAISPTLYAAAMVDGANVVQRFLRVTVPSMRIVIGVGIVLQVINSLQAFDVIFSLTQGGPSGSTTVLNLLVYRQAFQYLNFGQAAVLAIIAAVLTAGVIGLAAATVRTTATLRARRRAVG